MTHTLLVNDSFPCLEIVPTVCLKMAISRSMNFLQSDSSWCCDSLRYRMPNHITEEFSPLNNAFAVNDPSVTKFIPNRLIPGRLLEPNLLYRHDHNTIEVRFVNGCQQSVCGTLTANDFSRMLERTVRT
jgi:hypothetical protein